MSTARFLLALACCCTSAGLLSAGGSAVELELSLARDPSLYLRLDLSESTLEVMVRGVEVDRAHVRGARLVAPRSATVEQPELPAVWRIAADPEVQWRRLVAPPTLVPFSDGAEPAVPPVTPTSAPSPPAQYDVRLDNGWVLHIGADPPDGRWSRLRQRLATGWNRLAGRPVALREPAVVVELEPGDARRVLHLFRSGTALLVVCEEAAPTRPVEK